MMQKTSPSSVTVDQQGTEQGVTDEAVASFVNSGSPRYREVMQSLVRHLHSFARDVRLTTGEWEAAIGFLTRTGHITSDRRQEFILLSDVLGLSSLTVAINAPLSAGATESTVFGPFFAPDAPEAKPGADIANGAVGMPCYVSGTVSSADGTLLPGARIDIWQADDEGLYDIQRTGNEAQGRAWMRAGSAGEYAFWSVRPTAYPIPTDGPVGELIAAAGRSPMRPAHVHFMVSAPGHRTVVTHVFAAGDQYLRSDAVFGVKDSLIAEFAEHDGGTAPDGTIRSGRWAELAFDLVLVPERSEGK
jgi:hydroxyquinol 1,2-dioxygenase